MKFKLYEHGVENLLVEAEQVLNEGIKATSRKEKDKNMCRVLGLVEAMRQLLELDDRAAIVAVDKPTSDNTDEDGWEDK